MLTVLAGENRWQGEPPPALAPPPTSISTPNL